VSFLKTSAALVASVSAGAALAILQNRAESKTDDDSNNPDGISVSKNTDSSKNLKEKKMTSNNTPVSDALAWLSEKGSKLEPKIIDAGKKAASKAKEVASSASTQFKQERAERSLPASFDRLEKEIDDMASAASNRAQKAVDSTRNAGIIDPSDMDAVVNLKAPEFDVTIHDYSDNEAYNTSMDDAFKEINNTDPDVLAGFLDSLGDAAKKSAKKSREWIKEIEESEQVRIYGGKVKRGAADAFDFAKTSFTNWLDGDDNSVSSVHDNTGTDFLNDVAVADDNQDDISVDFEDALSSIKDALSDDEEHRSGNESPVSDADIDAILDLTGDDDETPVEPEDLEVTVETALDALEARETGKPSVVVITSSAKKTDLDALSRQASARGHKVVKLSTSTKVLSSGKTPLGMAQDKIEEILSDDSQDGVLVSLDARHGVDKIHEQLENLVEASKSGRLSLLVAASDDVTGIDGALEIH
jgi:hypothetical protein